MEKNKQEYQISENQETNRLINNIVSELKIFSDNLINHIDRLTGIGIALSSEGDIPTLLENIVDIAREFTNAEGGTLYILSPDKKKLCFEIVQNTLLKVRMGGTASRITWAPVQLFDDQCIENHSNVCAHVALKGKTIEIPDVYNWQGFDFSGTKEFDNRTGFRSKSMLVVPLKDHENEIIGVLQLLNAKSARDNLVQPFSRESQAMAESLASQAAVALTKNRLISNLEELFESFLKTIAKAIDEKSPYTGGHIKRVADIAMMIAEKIDKKSEGRFADVNFTKDQLTELRIASWMHDIGKITTPEYVVDKHTKLETIYDRIEEIHTRFEVFKRDAEIKYLKKRISLTENDQTDIMQQLDAEYHEESEKIEDDLKFLVTVNKGEEFLPSEKIERIKEISKKIWKHGEKTLPWLTEEEVYNLSISKGTLNREERAKIQDHVRLTEEMLNQLPFPKKLKNVPAYASAHHETLTGTGYHKGLKAEDIPLLARILALADIFEALSASDRPYKVGKTATEVIKILGFMVKDKHIDSDLFELFMEEKLFHEYVKAEYKPEQIDIELEGV